MPQFSTESPCTVTGTGIYSSRSSSEAYQFVKDGGGYNTTVADSNTAAALQTGELVATPKYRTLVDGFDTLPKELVSRFEAKAGQFFRNHRLASIRGGPGQPYELTFILTSTRDGLTTDKCPQRDVVVWADRVVLAMPRRSLELVSWEGFSHDGVRKDLESVFRQAAIKMFLAFDYPWWRAVGVHSGRSITDMPIRQTYYFGTEGEQPAAQGQKENTNSLMMVSYNDRDAVPFWKALEIGRRFEGRKNALVDPGEPSVPSHAFTVTRTMVRHAQEQVAEVHGQKFVPKPYSAIYHDWSENPYGGGWHAWKAGLEFWEIMKRIRKPLPDEDVFICGEAIRTSKDGSKVPYRRQSECWRSTLGCRLPPSG